MESFTRYCSATVLGTGCNNAVCIKPHKSYVFTSFYSLRFAGTYMFRLFFSNLVETTGNFERGTPGGKYRIKKACANLWGSAEKTDIFFGGKREKEVFPGEIFASDEFLFTYKKGTQFVLSFEVEAQEEILLPMTNESASTGLIFENGREIFSDGFALRPCFIGIKRDFEKTVGFFGDSITQGTRTGVDCYEAWAHRIGLSMPDSVSMWNVGMGWSRAYDAAAGGFFLERAAMCDEVFMCFGVNDIKSGGRSGEEVTADLERAAKLLREKNKNIKIYFMTVPPFDLERDAQRLKVNEYIKAKPEGTFFDIAAPLEGKSGRVRAKFKSAPDDAHPNALGGKAVFDSFEKWRERWLSW